MKSLRGSDFIMPLGLALGLFLFAFNVVGFHLDYFPGDMADGRLNLYFLEHAHKFFTGQTDSFWNAPFMFPEKNVIAYSDNLLGSAPIYSLFRVLGFELFKSYQLWYLVVTALNYIAAFYFLKYVFKNSYAALLGAFVFAFSIALQSQLTHAQTFPRFAAPLAFLMAVKFSEDLNPKYFLYSLLFLVYQLFCGIYLGLMLAVPLGIYLGLSIVNGLFLHKTPIFSFNWLLRIASSLLISLAILLPLMLPYTQRKVDPSMEHYYQIISTIPSIKSYFFSQEGSLVWDFLSKTGYAYDSWWDHQIFTGGVATISLIFMFIWFVQLIIKKKLRLGSLSAVPLLTITSISTLLIFLRFDNVSAYIALYFVPGFSSMRSLTRVINIELIFFSIATAFAFSQLFKLKFRHKSAVFALALALVICDNYFKSDKSYKTEVVIAQERVRELETAFSEIPKGSIISYEPEEMESSSIYYQIDGMLASQKSDLIAMNAYTATSPPDYARYWHEPNEINRNFWLQQNEIQRDSFYIVKGSDQIEKISFKEIPKLDSLVLRTIRMEDLINYIKSDEQWMKSIQEKADERKISLDSMLIMDANWIIENE